VPLLTDRFRPWRRACSGLGLVLGLSFAASGAVSAFTLDDVTALARERAAQPYEAPASNLPPEFSRMLFGDYIKIRPRPEAFAWREHDTPFKLAFYHQGMQFDSPVVIHEIVGDEVSEFQYDPAAFDFGGMEFDPQATSQLGYAGFRVLYPINQAEKEDEIMSVLGASYYRVIGKDQIYGLSGRGLAIETAMPHAEEFPDFRELWIERPAPGDESLVFYALLDSPRATGAYKYTLTPGEDSVLDVESRIFLREPVDKLGIAPLTSMFLFGPHQPARERNFRPAIHDSNGLAIETGEGEWLWRPLHNPPHLNISLFSVTNPRGFGLLQRGHEFWRYEDIEDRYDLRPSAWIEPRGNWGKGVVELVEIPTLDETNDNIVAFWSPERMPEPGQMQTYDYRIRWTLDEPGLLPDDLAWVDQTLSTAGEVRQANLIRELDGSLGLLVDFKGPVFATLPGDAKLRPEVDVNGNAEVIDQLLQRNPGLPGWRLSLRVRVKDTEQPVEMRARLDHQGKPVTETWSFQIPPGELSRQPHSRP